MTDLPQNLIDDFVGNAHGNFARVKELLEQHPNLLNANASWNEHAIEAASQVGSVEIIHYLLAAGAPTGICTEAVLGHLDNVKAYLDSDPTQANAKGAHGITVLYHAIIRANKEIAELLLARGADVNAGAGGSPPIHGAVMFNQPEMVEWLLAKGADVNSKNYEGKTPLKAAADGGKAAIADLLRKHGGAE
ncbi:MAG: ankyrin repeat domain-containing protein [Chloroflexi bacterium]|nr:ankyrin repeat domain-containing protein [Chloroflexota bacterium]